MLALAPLPPPSHSHLPSLHAATPPARTPLFPSPPAHTPRPPPLPRAPVRRIGLMGYNARPQNVALVLEAFRDGLRAQGKL